MQQLDIFNDSRDLQLRNDLAAALAALDAAAAVWARQALADEYPHDAALPAADVLIAALAHASDTAFADLAEALAARHHLQAHIGPAAQTVFGHEGAAPWLRAQWQRLAQRALALPYRGELADGHAAALWLQAGAWAQAAAAVQGIASWRRIPQPLAWMLQAQWQQTGPGGPDAAWPLLAELCWLAPERARQVMSALPDAALHKRMRRFEGEFADELEPADGPDGGTPAWAWFPAWLLVEQTLPAAPLGGAQAGLNTLPERGFRLVQSLLRLERQGRHHEVVAHRRDLLGLNARLFALYMKTR